MTATRRVNSRDIAQAGSLNELINKLIEHVRNGNMEMKEKAAMMLHSLCFQPRGLDGEQQADNDVLIAKAKPHPLCTHSEQLKSTEKLLEKCNGLANDVEKTYTSIQVNGRGYLSKTQLEEASARGPAAARREREVGRVESESARGHGAERRAHVDRR